MDGVVDWLVVEVAVVLFGHQTTPLYYGRELKDGVKERLVIWS